MSFLQTGTQAEQQASAAVEGVRKTAAQVHRKPRERAREAKPEVGVAQARDRV
ncbi:hypothetical protein DPMN_054950 [Dreissena polymorpha]|uniref:Uncharacterized protein n=1 Tax=Dreissena polymorpha TaxID=45954 RepID=A0A9D4CPV1_DREPO|nr:hypothetical protein DPMN_054950 [Dreissena polymorpha]